MKINKFIVLLSTTLLLACSGQSDEAKKLGFASVEEMKEIHAKGWHTKAKYDEDQNFSTIPPKTIEKKDGFKSDEVVKELPNQSLLESILDKKWSISNMPCNLNGGVYDIFYKDRGMISTLAGKEQVAEAKTHFEFKDDGPSKFSYKQIYIANDMVAKYLNDPNAISASIEMAATKIDDKSFSIHKKIYQLNFEQLLKGVKTYDVTVEEDVKKLCQ